jgi:hypothetical protein
MTDHRNPVRLKKLGRTFARLAVTLTVLAVAMGAEGASAAPRNEGASAVPAGIPGPLKIQNKASGMCLDEPGIGGPVAQIPCNGSDQGQRWGWFNGGWLKNLKLDKCLRGVGSEDFSVFTSHCEDVKNQHWLHHNFFIINGQSGLCLEPLSGAVGSPIVIERCYSWNWQNWQVTYW